LVLCLFELLLLLWIYLQIKMVVAGPCKMGISFWPMFSFKSPDREAKPGSARLITADAAAAVLADYQGLHAAAPTAVASVSGTGSSSSSSSTNSNAYTGSSKMSQVSAPQDQQQQQQLLLVDFTQDPPDEFSLGAKFLGGIPFPFLSIRTTQLKVTHLHCACLAKAAGRTAKLHCTAPHSTCLGSFEASSSGWSLFIGPRV
jgi:hypothetical protein